MDLIVKPPQLRAIAAALAVFLAAIGLFLSIGQGGNQVDATATAALIGAQAATPATETVAMPVLAVDVDSAKPAAVAVEATTSPIAGATAAPQPVAAAVATTEDTSTTDTSAEDTSTTDTSTEDTSTEDTSSTDTSTEDTSSEQPAPAPESTTAPEPTVAPTPEALALGAIKSKADDKGYDVHGHVEHSVYLLGQQVLIPGQAATGGFIQTSENNYTAYSPVTAMLPVAIQDNKEVLAKKPDLEGEKLYRRLAQEYTGSNDYKKLNKDAQRAINILTCTDWSLVDKKVRENTINHLLHSPISFGTIGSVENPISTDVTIDLGYTHTRDKNWTEVEYMGNNVYKITVVSNNNNGSHTGHAMGTAFVEMPAGTSLKEAQKIGNQMIPSKNKNNKLTIDPAAKSLFESLPRGASPMILFEHLSEAEQNAFFEGRGIETVGKANPDCNPLEGGVLGSSAPVDPAPEADNSDDSTDAPADDNNQAPATDDQAPATDDQAPATDGDDADKDAAGNDDQGTDQTSSTDADAAGNDAAGSDADADAGDKDTGDMDSDYTDSGDKDTADSNGDTQAVDPDDPSSSATPAESTAPADQSSDSG